MRAPVLAVGDGALGFWGALREVFPATREQRCWFHKIANVLGALPKSAHPGAKKALAEIWNAEDRRHALDAVTAFEAAYGAKFPKAVAKITDDLDELLAFYDYPAEHWQHLRTTNPIESTFATVRHRTKVTRGPGSRAAGLAMAFKLIEAAQDRWRAVNGPHLVALVRAGATFVERQARRTTRRDISTRSRLKDLHPQVLTIAPSGSAGAPTTFAYTAPGGSTSTTPSSATCTCHTRSWTYPPTPAWPWSPTAPTPEPPPTTPYGSLPAGPPPTTQPTPWHDHRRPNPPGQGRPETGDPHSDTRSCRAADSGAFRGWVVPGQRSACGTALAQEPRDLGLGHAADSDRALQRRCAPPWRAES